MLLVNLRTGETITLDFEKPPDLARWETLRRDRQSEISGLTLMTGGVHYVLPVPRRFDNIFLDAGPVEHRNGSGRLVGDRIALHADDVTATILSYRSNRPPMVRFSIERLGRPVFLPGREGGGE